MDNMTIYLFYIFSFFAIFFACLVITLQNTVYSVFSLIFVFLNIFAILLCLGVVEFLSIIVLIVYVGAVAILFLFTVMMLGAGVKETSEAIQETSMDIQNLLVFFLTLGYVFLFLSPNHRTLAVFEHFISNNYSIDSNRDFAFLLNFYANDISIFGNLLYTEYSELFYLITFVLFVTLIGSLVLSLCYYKPVANKEFLTSSN